MKKKFSTLAALLCCCIAVSFLVACNEDSQNVNTTILSSTKESSSQADSSNISSETSSTESSEISSAPSESKVTSNKQSSKVTQKPNASSKANTSSKSYTSNNKITSSKPKAPSSQGPSSVKQNSSVNLSSSQYAAIENEIFNRVNELRASVGVAPLTRSNALTQSALVRSKEMLSSGIFEHTRPDGTSFQTAIDQAGYKWSRIGENIAYCSGYSIDQLADVFFDGWKNSPGHYANMVKPEFTQIGIAIAGDGKTTYATQNFGTPK